MSFTLGLSPCPNDTFIFHALLHGMVDALPSGIDIEPYFADVQTLNAMALNGELPLTKLSFGVVPKVLDKYALLSSGSALGWGCGPLLVSATPDFDPCTATIAIPGIDTTANLLLDLHGGFTGKRQEFYFADIIPAVLAGKADLGLIIHEGRFTWQAAGLHKVLDFGQWWEASYNLPLPLGCIAIRRDVPKSMASGIQKAIAQSLSHAWAVPEKTDDFVRSHAREMDPEVISAHIRTFVTKFSLDLGKSGRSAITTLLAAAGNGASPESVFAESD